MSITVENIMKGRELVARQEIYSSFERRGLDSALIDDHVYCMRILKSVSHMILGVSIFFAALTIACFARTRIPISLFALGVGGIAVGTCGLISNYVLSHFYGRQKLDSTAVNQLLKEAKAAVMHAREGLCRSDIYQHMVQRELGLKRLEADIYFDQEMKEQDAVVKKDGASDATEVSQDTID